MSDKEFGGSEDLSLPKATVQKIISEIIPQLPPDLVTSNDTTFTKSARDLLIQCSMEFLKMVSSESNDISEKESKKTIAVEHVEQALTELGFADYIDGIRGSVDEWKGTQQKRNVRTEKMKNWGGLQMDEEQLRKMQEELFSSARGKMEGGAEEGSST